MRLADTSLRVGLDRVRRRWRRAVVLAVAWRLTVVATLALAVSATADRWLHPAGGVLLTMCGLAALVVTVAGGILIWPYRRKPDDRQVARFVEERCPALDDEIAAAVDADSHGSTSAFAALLVRRASERLSHLDPADVVSRGEILSSVRRLLAAAAVLALTIAGATPFLVRATSEARARYLPWSFSIDVRPGNVRLRSGSPLTISAHLDGRAAPVDVIPEVQLEAGGQVRRVPMTRGRDGYELRFNAVDRSFVYRVHAGNAASDPYAVTALVPPRIEAIDLRYDYPSFTSLPPRDEPDGGDIYAPAGTRVRLRVRADKAVAAAQLTLAAGGASPPVTRVDARTFESVLTLAKEGSYRASVADADGLRGESLEYFIRLVADRPPEIHIVRPAGDREITPLEEVTIEAKADDDFGIASMDMVFAVAGGREHVVPFQTLTGENTARVGSRVIAAEDLGVKPGDVISYYARARDVARAKASTLAHSEIYFLEVTPFDEDYSLAESQAMAAATGTELASLIAAQKEVISATWNLQRRAQAGSSAADVRAVAGAQAEVKARTEKAAVSARPARRGPGGMFFQFSRQPPAGRASDSVANAAEAMGRAVGQLNAGATKEAMPLEMAALNALLEAQAEIRQRQVAQQQNGSSTFGNGRQGQDLSTLFDRELKRQQRTNYESATPVENEGSRPDGTSALDRIRDLARRQEDLARQQEAANGLEEEQRRRELERLRREQEELRRQLESAARLPSAEGATRNSRHASPAGADAMRSATDEMRRAAAELQRNQPGSAARRAAGAAEDLHRAEAQMQPGGNPDRAHESETRKLADSLDALRMQRDRLTHLERRLSDLAREADPASAGRGRSADGRGEAAGARKDDVARGGDGAKADELERTRREYVREVQRARELASELGQSRRDTSDARMTPEEHEWSWGAPGTEAWKQDFAGWESLGKDAGRALERSEASVGARLAQAIVRDRLRAGASERVPDAYVDRVARYFESLTRGDGR